MRSRLRLCRQLSLCLLPLEMRRLLRRRRLHRCHQETGLKNYRQLRRLPQRLNAQSPRLRLTQQFLGYLRSPLSFRFRRYKDYRRRLYMYCR